MAGIGFELRKLYRKQGLAHHIKATTYSTMTTVGPMILCIILIFTQKWLMNIHNASYLQNELFIATITYCFVFSIIITSSFSLIVTRYLANLIYTKKYEDVINALYGSLLVVMPITAIIAILFLLNVEASYQYKIVAYIFFIELAVIWVQNVFMSALKDYVRISKGFAITLVISVISSFLLFELTSLDPVVIALLGMDIGFASLLILSSFHFEQVFPRNENKNYFAFLKMIKSHPSLLVSGLLVYSGVFIHNLIYWSFSNEREIIANNFKLMPFYDAVVFYAYLTVLPSLIFFVVIIETDFYERFLNYYRNVTEGGTFESLQASKKKMQQVLLYRIGFLAEIQLLFTILGIALGLTLLPNIGFTLTQIDIYITLCFAYFFFILMFILLHILMYFDDRKGVLYLALSFIVSSAILTYITMKLDYHGFGLFFSAFIMLCIIFVRLLYILKNIDYYTYCPQPIITIGTKKTNRIPRKRKIIPTSLLLVVIFLTGCKDNSESSGNDNLNKQQTSSSIQGQMIIDDKRIYERDDDAEVKTFYMTVFPDKKNPDIDWYSLNQVNERYNDDSLKVILAEGNPDGAGPQVGLFGADTTTPNAKVSIRGRSARRTEQKSYKINLLDSAGMWNDQNTINLNKHKGDSVRLRNKLSFDLMERIPYISSLRTQFVHLYVKDLTAGETTYQDYGLYTHVEQPNKNFLQNHLFDKNGYLYKVHFFEFRRYPDQIKLESDPQYDKVAFETILEVKGREEHAKLIKLLDDVNNFNIPINEIIEEHFVEENLLTWLAINILSDNMDTNANNHFLYSPLNDNRWLILPWDYDGGWEQHRKTEMIHSYKYGISNYWGNQLFNRYFRYEKNVDKLTAKIEELYEKYINENTVSTLLDKYGQIPLKYLSRYPDLTYSKLKLTDYEKELQSIIDTPKKSLELYYKDLQEPKPFFQYNNADVEGNEHVFRWDSSFDFQGDALYYTALVATDPEMKNIVAKAERIRETSLRTAILPSGKYYLKVTVEDEKGNSKGSFDQYLNTDENLFYYGVTEVEVK